MRIVCSWCGTKIGPKERKADTVSHGVCGDCVPKAMRELGEELHEHLSRFDFPVLMLDGANEIVSANQSYIDAFGMSLSSIRGKQPGNALACIRAREGRCGEAAHCRTCAIRNTVEDTSRTGRSHVDVPAFSDSELITGDERIRFRISTKKVGGLVELRLETAEPVPDADSLVSDRLRVVIVDDEPICVRILKKMLETWGHDVLENSCAKDAYRQILSGERVDLLITDLNMPHMDGGELIRQVRAQEELRDLPIIIVSGHYDKEEVSELLQLGLVSYLVKPTRMKVLKESIKDLMSQRGNAESGL
jgi:two-component system chemotaxis response regulator CheY